MTSLIKLMGMILLIYLYVINSALKVSVLPKNTDS